jgi:hypothetical protein
MQSREFLAILRAVLGSESWPKPLHLLQGLERLRAGEDPAVVAKAVGTSKRRLRDLANVKDVLKHVLHSRPADVPHSRLERSKLILGQLVLGRAAEVAFEHIYRSEMMGQEFQLKDLRESRTDTDYRLLNGQGRSVYRLNIKFHGSLFHRAPELVGLNSEDCFALATYKIASALEKQEQEGLPYLFAIVGVPGLSGQAVGEGIPPELVHASAFMHHAPKASGKRAFEDRVVDYLVTQEAPVFKATLASIETAVWYILSARRAANLMRDLLFDRVFALRIRGFARVFGKAELDMHFSLAQDLVPLRRFLTTLRDEGSTKVTTLLERGDF